LGADQFGCAGASGRTGYTCAPPPGFIVNGKEKVMGFLSDRDWQLSMRTSPRSRSDARNSGLRSLIVHRLRDKGKAVVRIPLKRDLATADGADDYNVYCEPCDAWFVLRDWGEEVCHDKCGRVYTLEFAVLSEIKDPKEE
jgi:hypothetical protein